MTVKRYAAKRDSNEREIIDALTRVGATVIQLSEKDIPDLLIGYHGDNYLAEVKAPKGKLKDGQKQFIEAWEGQATVIYSVEDALWLIGAID